MGKAKDKKRRGPQRVLEALLREVPELCAPCKCRIIGFAQRSKGLHFGKHIELLENGTNYNDLAVETDKD